MASEHYASAGWAGWAGLVGWGVERFSCTLSCDARRWRHLGAHIFALG